MIPYGRQNITEEDIAAVESVLKSDFLTQGPIVPRFERAIANYCSVEYAVAVNSATSALHIACMALKLGTGDWLWTSPNTFVASANCGLYCGANVDFVDIDPHTYNMSVEALTSKLEQAEKNGRLPKIVIPVHFAGQPCDMSAIYALKKKYGFKIIEDASHAIGAKYENGHVGNCLYSDITIFSFHPVKIITTGEGGAALTNSFELANFMRKMRSHGITRNEDEMDAIPDGAWYYQQLQLGYNYRLTDMQAALGLSQINKIPEFLKRRKELAHEYNNVLEELALTLPAISQQNNSAWHLYVVNLTANPRRMVFDALRAMGVGVNVHYIPVHLQPYYRKLGFNRGDFPESERYYDVTLSLPIHPGMSQEEFSWITSCVCKIVNKRQ